VRYHRAIPGRPGRDNRHHDAAGHEQFSGIGDNAVLRSFAITEKVGWVGQHQTHRARRAGGTLEGAGEDGSVWQALPCNIGAVGADLYAIEPCPWNILAGCQQIALACRGIKDGGDLSYWKVEQMLHDPLGEQWWRTYKGRATEIS